jgi:hypothetical protein
MTAKAWWIILTVLVGALIAGSLLAVQYAKQHVPQDKKAPEGVGTRQRSVRCVNVVTPTLSHGVVHA